MTHRLTMSDEELQSIRAAVAHAVEDKGSSMGVASTNTVSVLLDLIAALPEEMRKPPGHDLSLELTQLTGVTWRRNDGVHDECYRAALIGDLQLRLVCNEEEWSFGLGTPRDWILLVGGGGQPLPTLHVGMHKLWQHKIQVGDWQPLKESDS